MDGLCLESLSRTFNTKAKNFYGRLKAVRVSSVLPLLSIEPIGCVQFINCIYPVMQSTQSFACANSIFIVQHCPICAEDSVKTSPKNCSVESRSVGARTRYQNIRHPCSAVADRCSVLQVVVPVAFHGIQLTIATQIATQ